MIRQLKRLADSPATYPLSTFWAGAMAVLVGADRGWISLASGVAALGFLALLLIMAAFAKDMRSLANNQQELVHVVQQLTDAPIIATTKEPKKMRDYLPVASVRWALSIVFVVCLTATLLVSLQSNRNDANLDAALKVQQAVIVQQDANTRALKATVNDICEASNTAARGTNEVLQTLINAVTATKSLPPAEKVDRIRKYKAAMVAPLRCQP